LYRIARGLKLKKRNFYLLLGIIVIVFTGTIIAIAAYTSLTIPSHVTIVPYNVSYVFTGPVDSSGWVIIYTNATPTAVYSNETGAIPQYASLYSLNATTIGFKCANVNITTGACISWVDLNQEGWFYNTTANLLYIHYRVGYITPLDYNVVGDSLLPIIANDSVNNYVTITVTL